MRRLFGFGGTAASATQQGAVAVAVPEPADDRTCRARRLTQNRARQAAGFPELTAARDANHSAWMEAQARADSLKQNVFLAQLALDQAKERLNTAILEDDRALAASAPPILGAFVSAFDRLIGLVQEVPLGSPDEGTVVLDANRVPKIYNAPLSCRPAGTANKLRALQGEVLSLAYRPEADLDAELTRIGNRAETLAGYPLEVGP